MSGYTPGPWVASTPPFTGGHVYTDTPGGRGVTVANLTPIDERDANARLIAAAPELVEALGWIAANYENGDLNHVDFRVEAKHRADAAIAKARGET